MNRWDYRYLELAKNIASWSRDPSTKVGAVIARPDKTLASVGFNGFPRGVEDREDRLQHRETKYALTVHAEMNAILHAREPLHGYTLYVAPLMPCANCAAGIIQAGIKRVVAYMPEINERWTDSFSHTQDMFLEANIEFALA